MPSRIGDFAALADRFTRMRFGRKSRRRRYELQLVSNSGIFDSEWYLQAYPDVAEARADPLRHYMELGWREGRNPGPDFSTSAYLKANPDVAAANVNPLLHFLEFGYFEGRTSPANRLPPQRTPYPANFDAAAACFSIPLPENRPIRWKRSYRLDHDRADLVWAGDHAVGFAPEVRIRKIVRSSFSLLKQLSGERARARAVKPTELIEGADRFLDGWYVNRSQLRTRWGSDRFPLVVRAFQHDPLDTSKIVLVGEALLQSSLDVFDVHLRNPLFPVLFAFVAPDGTIRGAKVLAFPSLCRGGLHYAEWLNAAGAADAPADPVALADLMASRLPGLLNGTERPAITSIQVELAGADGRGPLFQSDVRNWLKCVIQIAVEPIEKPHRTSVERYLASAVRLASAGPRNGPGATLSVSHDMIPTIGAVSEPYQPREEECDEVSVPLIISSAEPNGPKILIDVPTAITPSRMNRSGRPSEWPRLRAGLDLPLPRSPTAAAIAIPLSRSLSEAELFLTRPHAPPSEDLKPRPPITWMIETRGWPKEALAKAVYALSLQTAGAADCLRFLGAPDPLSWSVASERFARRVDNADSLAEAVVTADTPLIGFSGAGILFHDNWTAIELASLLTDEKIATASCVIINANHVGAGTKAAIADGGALRTPSGTSLRPTEYRDAVAHLWRSHYAVATPVGHLWLARIACLRRWIEAPQVGLGDRFHICSSAITASQVARHIASELPPFIPTAPENRVTRVQALFG